MKPLALILVIALSLLCGYLLGLNKNILTSKVRFDIAAGEKVQTEYMIADFLRGEKP